MDPDVFQKVVYDPLPSYTSDTSVTQSSWTPSSELDNIQCSLLGDSPPYGVRAFHNTSSSSCVFPGDAPRYIFDKPASIAEDEDEAQPAYVSPKVEESDQLIGVLSGPAGMYS